MQAEFYNYVE